MNSRPEVTVDMRDVEVVSDVLKEKWISVLAPEAEIQRLSMNIVLNLNKARADRK